MSRLLIECLQECDQTDRKRRIIIEEAVRVLGETGQTFGIASAVRKRLGASAMSLIQQVIEEAHQKMQTHSTI